MTFKVTDNLWSTVLATAGLLVKIRKMRLVSNNEQEVVLQNTNDEYEQGDNEQHDSKQCQVEDASVGLHPAPVHRPTENPQHPVVDVDSNRTE